VRTLIKNCVRRDRQQRIGDLAVVQYVLDNRPPTGPPAQTETPPRRKRSGTATLVIAVLTGAVAAAAAWSLRATPSVRPAPVSRFGIPLGPDQAFNGSATSRHLVAVSPDGRYIAYEANAQLYLRALDQLEAAPVRGTNELPFEPFFSPDGQSIAYFTGSGQLKRIGIGGGSPVTICNAQPPFGASWSGDRIFFGQLGTGIFEVPATGGTPRVVLANDPKQYEVFHGPQLLPDGQTLLFTAGSPTTLADRWTSGRIEALSLTTGRRKVLVRAATDGRYLPTGHLVYGREGVLYAIAFDPNTLETKGSAAAIVQGVAQAGGSTTGAMQASFSNSGAFVYLPFTAGSLTTIVWRDRRGNETPIAAPPHVYQTPRLSPDGSRIAVHATDQDNDIWIWDVVKETLTRLTFDKGVDSSPVWSRDLSRIFYASAKDGPLNLFWKPSNGTGRPEALFATAPETNSALVVNSMSPDGRMLIYSAGVPADVLAVPVDGEHKPVPLMAQRTFAERGGDVSPDGRWIAYYSDESGGFQVYVRPFPTVDQGRWQISGDGGTVPRFAPNGRELFYVNGQNQLVSTTVVSGPTFSFGKTSVVMDLSDSPPTVYRNYDVAPDGRIVLIKQAQRTRAPQQFIAVLNWFTELNERVPVGR
jgi:serine/threonine-protein kinase